MILAGFILLVHFVSGVVFLQRHWGYVQKIIYENVAGDIQSVVTLIEEKNLSWNQIQRIARYHNMSLSQVSLDLSGAGFSLRSSRLLTELRRHIKHPITLKRAHDTTTVTIQIHQRAYQFRFFTQRLGHRTMRLFVTWALGVSFIFLIIAILMMRQQTRPLRRLAKWFYGLTQGSDLPLPRIEGAREIRRIAEGLQMMVNQLKKDFEERNEMLLAISHDLRTPLTRLKLQVQLMPKTPEHQGLKSDIDHMIAMLNGYLEFAQQDKAPPQEVISLRPLLKECLKNNASSDLVFLDQCTQDHILAHPTQILGCLQNLLSNAQSHGAPPTILSIQGPVLSNHRPYVVVSVEDNGPGVSEIQKSHIFKPFFTGISERTTQGGSGTGLGLAIVKRIMHHHQGWVTVQSSTQLAGASFQLWFPLALTPGSP